MARPTIAVIVPLLNERERLLDLLEMLNELNADEVMLVDGGSTDGTREMISKARFSWCSSEAGRSLQMNRGAEQCRSGILLFIHADTLISSSHIAAVKEALTDTAIVGGRFDISLSGRHAVFRVIEWMINVRSRLSRINTGDQCQFVRRDVFERLNGFPHQPLMEDIEFSKQLKRMGSVAALSDRVVTSSRRWEQHGIIRTILLMWKLRLLYWMGSSPDYLVKIYRDAR